MESTTRFRRRQWLKMALSGGIYGLLSSQFFSACGGSSPVDEADHEGENDLRGQKIIVVGAGVAGLSAAQKLTTWGAEVVIVEARDRIGGRLWTDRSLGAPFEIGAGWIHGPENNPVSELAAASATMPLVTDDDNLVVYDRNGNILPDEIIDPLDKILESLLDEVDEWVDAENDRSLASAIDAVNTGALNDELILWALTTFTEFDTGGAIEDLSAAYFNADSAFRGADVILPAGFDAILEPLAANLDIRLGHVVEKISYDNSGIQITTSRGEFAGNFAVVTLPLGVLKQQVVAFDPELPTSFRNRVTKIPMGNVTKVALKFDEAFWDPAVQYFGYLSEIKGKWPYFLNYRAFADANILVALSFGAYPAEVERRPDAEIRAEVMDILRTMFGANAPEPLQCLVTRWSADPYAYGAYSFTGTGVEPEDFDNLAGPVGERLYFAGEHATFAYHGTVHGAQLSGIAAAKAIGDQVG